MINVTIVSYKHRNCCLPMLKKQFSVLKFKDRVLETYVQCDDKTPLNMVIAFKHEIDGFINEYHSRDYKNMDSSNRPAIITNWEIIKNKSNIY